MIISFANFDNPIQLNDRGPVVLNMENPILFSRVCQSLISCNEEEALEPYSVWDEHGNRLKAANSFISVLSPFDLPWEHKHLQGSLYSLFDRISKEDEEYQFKLKEVNEMQQSLITSLSHQLDGDYCFALEWNLVTYLKTFRFGIDSSRNDSLLDNLINFIDLVADIGINEVLIFINLKTYFDKKELHSLYERLFFHEMTALLLENQSSQVYSLLERKYVIDQHFVEYEVLRQSVCSSSTQRRICSDGFGAVTF